MAVQRGPYLSAALLCERLLVEKDELKSAIRIYDRTTRTATGPEAPLEMEPFVHETVLFVRFKSGDARGPKTLRITHITPGGETPVPPFEQQVYFEGEEDRGVDIVVNLRLRVTVPGVHWFYVDLDDQPVTRVPWRVIYSPVRRRT